MINPTGLYKYCFVFFYKKRGLTLTGGEGIHLLAGDEQAPLFSFMVM
jgi:hypothetical protein